MSSAAEPMRVLHVDDEPDHAELTAEFLEREDDRFEVATATSADEGLARLAEAEFDCVVSDYDMPGRNGLEFLGAVREDYPDLPFVLFTGKGSEEVASDAISAGVSDYLQKRVGSDQYALLANRVENAVDGYRTEQALEETRRRFRTLVEEATDVILVVAPDGTIRYATPSAEHVLGRSPDELVGTDGFAPVHPDDEAAVQGTFAALLDDPAERRTAEFRYETPDGDTIWVEARGRNLLDDPVVGGVVVYVRDTTGRKAYERELERIRDFFTEAERLGNLGAWEFDASGEVTWTEGTRRIHEVDAGYEPTVEDGIAFVHEDDRAAVREAVEGALESGEPYDVEARLVTAAGDERWVRTRGKPVDGGSTVRGFIQDVTGQKEREGALARAKSQLEAAVEAGAVGTWEWHVGEDRLVAGPAFARTFGVDPDEARAGVPLERFTAAIHGDDLPRVERKIAAAVEACGDYEAEYRVRDAEGELRWVVARGAVECDEDGEPARFPGAVIDITERKAAEEALRRQNERLDEFASVVSHDLRNPLSVAEGRLRLARAACDSDHLDAVGRALERMEALIDDLLALSRGGPPAEPGSVALASVVDDCWANVDTAGATLAVEVDGEVRGDERRLRHLFENLFRNAVEHGGEAVTVGAVDGGFYVEDDGPGIPAGEREAAFETGYSTVGGGTGFGLSIVKQVVDAHGWSITVADGEEGGARFEVTGVEYA